MEQGLLQGVQLPISSIGTVAVYSEADKDALHTKLADEAICIGPANSKQSYLNIKNIIEAAYITKADSIHPGFGFLSENSQFAKICEESNIKFIGPNSKVIELLGNKSNSKEMMKKEEIYSAMVVYGLLTYDNGMVFIPNKELMGSYAAMAKGKKKTRRRN